MTDARDAVMLTLDARLQDIPTVFARLVLLAELRRPGSKLWKLVQFGAEPVRRDAAAISVVALRNFRHWLALGTKQKAADLKVYLRSLGRVPNRNQFLEFCQDLVPLSASEAEADLFFGAIKFIASALENEFNPSA